MIFFYIFIGFLVFISFSIVIYINILDRRDRKNKVSTNTNTEDVKKVLETNNLSKTSVTNIQMEETVDAFDDEEDVDFKFIARKNNNVNEVEEVDDVFNRIESNINSRVSEEEKDDIEVL